MYKISETSWWIGYALSIFFVGFLFSEATHRMGLNIWAGTAAIIAVMVTTMATFLRLFVPKERDN